MSEIALLESIVSRVRTTHLLASIALAEARVAWHEALMAYGDDRGRPSVAQARAVHDRAGAALAMAEARLAEARAEAERTTAHQNEEHVIKLLRGQPGGVSKEAVLSTLRGSRRARQQALGRLELLGIVSSVCAAKRVMCVLVPEGSAA